MSKGIILVADSPNLQTALAGGFYVAQKMHIRGKNSLDEFYLRGGGGSVSLCKIVSVPSAGYGNGTAKMITGYNADGTPVLSEEEIPVFIPRL